MLQTPIPSQATQPPDPKLQAPHLPSTKVGLSLALWIFYSNGFVTCPRILLRYPSKTPYLAPEQLKQQIGTTGEFSEVSLVGLSLSCPINYCGLPVGGDCLGARTFMHSIRFLGDIRFHRDVR